MALIDIDDFKDVLGVGDLYPDATLQSAMDTAEQTLIPFLRFNRAGIIARELRSNVAKITTLSRHNFNVGDSVVVSGINSTFNGTKTVTAKTDYTFSYAKTNADVDPGNVYPPGNAMVGDYTLYDTTEAVRTAALMIAVDVWNARQSAQGQAQGVDFVPGPYRMGRSILSKVLGLIAPYRDVQSMVG